MDYETKLEWGGGGVREIQSSVIQDSRSKPLNQRTIPLSPALNLTFVTALCIFSGIIFHSVIPRFIGLFNIPSKILVFCLNLILFLLRRFIDGL